MSDQTQAICYFSCAVITGCISSYLYSKHRQYHEYENEIAEQSTEAPGDIRNKLKDPELAEQFKNEGKMSYITGIAVSPKMIKEARKDPLKILEIEPPSFLVTSNPKNNEITNMLDSPTKLILRDEIDVTRTSVNLKYEITRKVCHPFFLLDYANKEMIFNMDGNHAELYAPRAEIGNNSNYIRELLVGTVALAATGESFTYNHFQNVIYEGDIVTIAGIIKYNLATDSLFFDKTEVISSGGEQNLLYYFRDRKDDFKIGFGVAVAVTAILAGVGAYFYLKHRKNKEEARKRAEFEKGKQNIENIPEDQLCTICFASRRDVIILPCNHLVMCRFCFAEIRGKCTHCSQEFDDHIVLDFK
ncbi:unnamed protein product [Moneuplotes crassus]|uniref:RING-type domain-containing protein n=1 Tax=Euplotes crassus TaxID=5936 RepID=A0AAD1UP56_EUPCR|nr:unnamed protein product [Moneuplotes crassus]